MPDKDPAVKRAREKARYYKMKKEDPAKVNAAALIRVKKYQAKRDPAVVKIYQRRRKLKQYGLTIDEFDKIVLEQNGVCAICCNPPGKIGLVVDHDHVTGKTRQLLCSKCNSVLGYSNDSIDILQKAIEYVRRHSALSET